MNIRNRSYGSFPVLFTAVAILVALLSGFTPPATAQPLLAIPDQPGRPGDLVEVPVHLAGAEGVVAFQFDLLYDPAVLVPRSPEAPAALDPHVLASSEPGAGRLRVMVFPPVTAPLPELSTEQVVTLRFDVDPQAEPQRSELRLVDVVLSDRMAGGVTATTGAGAVVVSPGSLVPEIPTLGSVALMALALLLGAAAWSRLAA